MLPEKVNVTIPIKILLKVLALSPLAVVIIWWIFTWPWDSQNAPAWVQAVGSIVAILAAWFIPLRHELDKDKRKRAAAYENLRWIAVRLSVQCDRMLQILEDPATRYPYFIKINDLELWRVHNKLINDFPFTDISEMDMVLIVNLRTVAAIGLSLAIDINSWGEEVPVGPIHKNDNRRTQALDNSRIIEFVMQRLSREIVDV